MTLYLVQDNMRPEFESATVDGTELVVTMNEDLDDQTLTNDAFTVKKTPEGGREESVDLSSSTAPVIDGRTVTITLADAAAATDREVLVSYNQRPATGGRMTDLAGAWAPNFYDQLVKNELAPPPVLVGNTGQTANRNRSTTTYDLAQGFTTGRSQEGYLLEGVALEMEGSNIPLDAVTLRSGSPDGAILATLQVPGFTSGVQSRTFRADPTLALDPETQYWVVMEGGDVEWAVTDSGDEDAGGHTGFTIADGAVQRLAAQSSGSYSGITGAQAMQVHGLAKPVAAGTLVSNTGQTSSGALDVKDYVQEFFTGARRGGRFVITGVDLTFESSGDTGTLTLYDSASITIGGTDTLNLNATAKIGDFVATASSVTATTANPVTVTYTPTGVVRINASGFGYLAYNAGTAKLGGTDSTEKDAASKPGWTIEDQRYSRQEDSTRGVTSEDGLIRFAIKGYAVPAAPTAPPDVSVRHVYRVPAELSIDFNDPNGTTGNGDTSDSTFKWQRFLLRRHDAGPRQHRLQRDLHVDGRRRRQDDQGRDVVHGRRRI